MKALRVVTGDDEPLVLERVRGVRTRFVVRRGNTHYFVPMEQVDWMDVADTTCACTSGGGPTSVGGR
jgi:hypothetical protein